MSRVSSQPARIPRQSQTKQARKSEQPTLVSLFTGAGGLDIGLEKAGFRTVFATDFDDVCVTTLKQNQERAIGVGRHRYLAGAEIVSADVATLRREDFHLPHNQELDLLVGGPPCQPFSSAGRQLGLDDPRGTLFQQFARIVRELRPRMFLFENVRGLVTARGPSGRPGEALELVRASFEAAGYSTRCALLNAADFGCPQRRVRLFIIGSRTSVLPEFPVPTHSEEQNVNGLPLWLALDQFLASMPTPALDEIVRPTDTLARQLAHLPPGSGLKSAGVKEQTRPGGHWGYRQGTFIADASKPARTVTAASTQDWVRLSDGSLRRLTLRECAALQGFPAEWTFAGNRARQYRQVGNAVPTALSEAIGQVLVRAAQISRASSGVRPPSAVLPAKFHEYVSYTTRDEARNGASRPRSRFLAPG
jgi:DNA (cytosine-5)-methyltransferase 1